jgi:polyhydroxyalkanoate synthesis regulator phasin
MTITTQQFESTLRTIIREETAHLATKAQVENLSTSIDGLAKAVKDLTDELKVQRHRVDRIEQHVGIMP